MVFTLTLGAAVVVVGLMAPPRPVSGDAAAAGRLPAACDPTDPESCLYSSDLTFDVGIVDGVSLTDPARSDYEIPLLIRYPRLDTVEPRPVVIWNHGGAPSQTGATRSAEWGNLLAAAGYVVIHPARLPLADPTPLRAECEANGVLAPDECSHCVAQAHLRAPDHPLPHRPPGRRRRPRPSPRPGCSTPRASSSPAIRRARPWRWPTPAPGSSSWTTAPSTTSATTPQSPSSPPACRGRCIAGFHSGFQPADAATGSASHSFGGIDRPFMFITGVGDETGEPPESRTTAWLTAQGTGDLYLSWDTDRRAVHETMDIDNATPRCDPTTADGSAPPDSPSSTPSSACDPRPGTGSTPMPTACSPAAPSSSTTADTTSLTAFAQLCPHRDQPLLVGLTTTPPGRDGAAVDRNPAGRDGKALTALLIDDDAPHPLR